MTNGQPQPAISESTANYECIAGGNDDAANAGRSLPTARMRPHEQRRWDLASVFPERDSDIAERIKRPLNHGYGLVLVAGASGAGKSATLAAMLGYVAAPERKVASIEDPVEVLIPGVQQIPAHPEHLPLARYLMAALRADLDVIMLHDLADVETVAAATTASQTGHTLMAAMDARSAPVAVDRLTNLSIDRGQVAEELRLVVAQRLVKSLCSECSADGEPRGCGDCKDGYAGRVALAETIEVDDDMREAIQQGKPATALKKPNGYRSFEEHAAALIANKITTQAETERACGAAIPPALLEMGALAATGTGM